MLHYIMSIQNSFTYQIDNPILWYMKRITSRDIIKKIKDKAAIKKETVVTFRINTPILEQFKRKCEAEAVTMTSVVEQFMEDFASEEK